MLESLRNHVVCGGIVDNGEFTEIYCNLSTGDCAFEGTIDGFATVVGEVSVDNPIPVDNVSSIKRGLEDNQYADAIGIILCKDKVIAIMADETAEIRTLATANEHSSTIINIDLDQEYEYSDSMIAE